MFNPEKQFRCTIIRGKAKKDLDDLLPLYTKIIMSICPCSKEDFINQFESEIKNRIANANTKKALSNHRTEIAGKLFGLYVVGGKNDDFVYPSERAIKYFKDNDQPAFFKDLCYKMQFPNAMSKKQTYLEMAKNKIRLRNYCFIIKVLRVAKRDGLYLTKMDIYYYVLNSLEVLQGKVSAEEIILKIREDRLKGITRTVEESGKATSYTTQHMREQLNYLELANLIHIGNDRVTLNEREKKSLDTFEEASGELGFDFYEYEPIEKNSNELERAWNEYYTKLSSKFDEFYTTPEALLGSPTDQTSTQDTSSAHYSTVQIGNYGENIVLDYEKQRVTAFDSRLTERIKWLGQERGLGYDIQSVLAELGNDAEETLYIEVKTTLRKTLPDIGSEEWVDSVNITKNEWIAALNYSKYFYIYRIFITGEKILLLKIKNISKKCEDGLIQQTATAYSLDFDKKSIDENLLMEKPNDEFSVV